MYQEATGYAIQLYGYGPVGGMTTGTRQGWPQFPHDIGSLEFGRVVPPPENLYAPRIQSPVVDQTLDAEAPADATGTALAAKLNDQALAPTGTADATGTALDGTLSPGNAPLTPTGPADAEGDALAATLSTPTPYYRNVFGGMTTASGSIPYTSGDGSNPATKVLGIGSNKEGMFAASADQAPEWRSLSYWLGKAVSETQGSHISRKSAGWGAVTVPTAKGCLVQSGGTGADLVLKRWCERYGYHEVGTTDIEIWYNHNQYLNAGTLVPTATRFYAEPYICSCNQTVVRLGCYVSAGTTGGKCRIGIYDTTDAPGDIYPKALVVDSGEITCSTSGAKTATVSAELTPWRIYWIASLWTATTTLPTVGSGTWVYNPLGIFMVPVNTYIDPFSHLYVTQSWGALPSTYPSSATMASANYSGRAPSTFLRF